MAIDIAEYKTLYITTARDLIQIMRKSLDIMKHDRCDADAIAEFHRAAHSFKSQSLVMGYTQSGLAAKMLEQIFHDLKNQVTCATEQTIPIIDRIVNKLAASIDAIEQKTGDVDLTSETDELSQLTSIPVR